MKSLGGVLLAAALVLVLTAETASARGGPQGMRGRGGASQQAFGAGYLSQQQLWQQQQQLQARLQQQYRLRAGASGGQYSYSGVPAGTSTYRTPSDGAGQCLLGSGLQQGSQHRYGASRGNGTQQRIRTPNALTP